MQSASIKKWFLVTALILVLVYIGWVVYFEARLGYLQPEGGSTIVIATFDDEGERNERVVRLEQIDGENYIAANHWPRAWYNQALEKPNIEVRMDDSFAPYLAVPLEGEEEARIREIYSFGFGFRFQTGFPPRKFMRLDPL